MKAPIVSGLARAKHEYGRLLVARRCATASSKTLEVVDPSETLEQVEVSTICTNIISPFKYLPLQPVLRKPAWSLSLPSRESMESKRKLSLLGKLVLMWEYAKWSKWPELLEPPPEGEHWMHEHWAGKQVCSAASKQGWQQASLSVGACEVERGQ